MVVGGIVAHCERQAVSPHHADQGRTAGVHVTDNPRRIRGRAQSHGFKCMRQLGLVDDAESILADRPDRAVMLAINSHSGLEPLVKSRKSKSIPSALPVT